ncbi:hypothetical protein HELRODRAFT_71060 [Helobdella robusta]|uniref:Carbonic anhydrase n=1 Tax=Helobdella robusta TaxID=6412 RepID=T1G0G2_HELRO|nr:hypothetical protein HELRODRAFT_71060 [Helobdella robusta]ESN90579.1 hypothetical protein HELRODRAFT_71060 [Helobdella robusta]
MSNHWGYGKKNGPSRWTKYAPAAKGKRQSPVNIITKKCSYDPRLNNSIFTFDYTSSDAVAVFNNGHSVQVELSESATSSFSGGPAEDRTYNLKQFHFHWGSKDGVGSEHKVNGKSYSAELHLVHWNSKYDSFEDALQEEDGLMVLTMFINIGDEHEEISKLTNLFENITFPDDKEILPDGFDFNKLLPENTDEYWTYKGSLTTPPCLEVVQFVIFKEPIEISSDQIEAFRSLKSSPANRETDDPSSNDNKLVDNYRPVMPLGNRVIYASFQ